MLNGWHHLFLCGQWCVSAFCQGLGVHDDWDHPRGNFLILMLWFLERFSSVSPIKIEPPIIMPVPGG